MTELTKSSLPVGNMAGACLSSCPPSSSAAAGRDKMLCTWSPLHFLSPSQGLQLQTIRALQIRGPIIHPLPNESQMRIPLGIYPPHPPPSPRGPRQLQHWTSLFSRTPAHQWFAWLHDGNPWGSFKNCCCCCPADDASSQNSDSIGLA